METGIVWGTEGGRRCYRSLNKTCYLTFQFFCFSSLAWKKVWWGMAPQQATPTLWLGTTSHYLWQFCNRCWTQWCRLEASLSIWRLGSILRGSWPAAPPSRTLLFRPSQVLLSTRPLHTNHPWLKLSRPIIRVYVHQAFFTFRPTAWTAPRATSFIKARFLLGSKGRNSQEDMDGSSGTAHFQRLLWWI